jgi:hypothetical protein
MITYLELTHFFKVQVLSADGSNITKSYLRLRTSLQHNDALYTIIVSVLWDWGSQHLSLGPLHEKKR